MNEETKKALLRSIFIKWEGILSCKNYDRGSGDCPLCELFNNGRGNDLCEGCPVFLDTGNIYCSGTPYEDWDDEAGIYDNFGQWVGNRIHRYSRKVNVNIPDLAVREQEYLISLLPQKDIDNLETLYKDFVQKEDLK